MKRNLFFILLVAFQLCFIQLSAQKNTGSIEGKIISADGSPAFVTLELKKTKKIALTDASGHFKFSKLAALQDTLIITSVESSTLSLPIFLEKNGTINLGTIRLNYNIAQLQNVEIKGRMLRSYKSDYSFFGNKTETGTKDIPQAISAITKELIQDKMEFTLKDAVDAVSGVNQYSGYDEYTIRGFRAENARDINGLRGYNTTYTSNMLVNIERIEVIKGPTATLYGNCDPGGTINLVTKKPLEKNEAEINLYGGSWNHFRAEGDVTGPLNKSKTFLYRLNAGYDNSNSFRDLHFARSYQIAPSFTFVPNDKFQVNVDFSLSHISSMLDRGQPGFQNDLGLKSTPISLTVSQAGDYLRETDIASTVAATYKFNKHLSFSTGFLNYITQQDVADHGVNDYITNDSVSLYYTTWNYHTVTNTITNYFTYLFKTGKANHQLLAGYDFIRSKVNLNQQYYELPNQFGAGSGIVGTFCLKNPSYFQRPISSYQPSDFGSDATDVNSDVYTTQGAYIQDQISWNKWKLLFSLREEFYEGGDDDDSAGGLEENVFLPRVGLVYELKPNLSLYATYNKGFDPFEASTSTQVFDQPFKPIISQLWEGGVKGNFFNNKLSASIALYQLTLQNVAVNANNISNPNLFIQQGEDRSRGFEAEANGNILPNLSISASFSHNIAKVIKSKIAAEEGTLVENAPKNTSNTWIKYTFSKGTLKGFGVAVGHSQVSARTTLQDGLILPSYFILNGGIRYEHQHLIAAINLNNITNQHYWTGAYNNVNKWPGAPINFMVNLGYRF